MIKRAFWIGVLLACVVLPFSLQEPLSFVASPGIATVFAADEDVRENKRSRKHFQEVEKEKKASNRRKDSDDKKEAGKHSVDRTDAERHGGLSEHEDSALPTSPAPPPPGGNPTPLPITVSSDAPAQFPVGVTQVTWTATDANGNSATASQIVTVNAMDSTAPVVTAPAAVTLEATGATTPVVLGTATALDAIDGALAVSNNAPPAGFPVGVTTVTYTATDAVGNIGTATQAVTITDTTPPVISIQQPAVTIEAIPPQVTVSLGVVTATDLVNGALTPANNAPAIYSMGVTQVIWSVTDAAGNTATATQTIVIQDTTPPVMTAPAAMTVDSTTGQPIAVAIGQATATDAFTPVTISNNAPAAFPIGITTVTWTATDPNGNSATATQTVTVNNASPVPVVGLPPDPGVAGQATLAGIDSDNDGVRDDVQRWIALTYPNSQKTRAALSQMAIAMQSILINSADAIAARKYSDVADKAADCISYVRKQVLGGNTDAYNLKRELEAGFLNTPSRSRSWLQADSYLSGMLFGIPSDLKQGCNFDPDVMPN